MRDSEEVFVFDEDSGIEWPIEPWATWGCGRASETMLVVAGQVLQPKTKRWIFLSKGADVTAFIQSNWQVCKMHTFYEVLPVKLQDVMTLKFIYK